MNQYSFILQFGNIVAISFIAFPLHVILQLKRVCSNEWKNINSVAKWTISASGSKFRENRLLNATILYKSFHKDWKYTFQSQNAFWTLTALPI